MDERQPGVHLHREASVGRRDERPAADAKCFCHEAPLADAVPDVLDHRIREDDVELAVGERQVASVALDVPNRGVPAREARPVVQPEGGDALGPRIALLEEVERAAAVALSETQLVGTHVEHRCLRRRLQLVQEEPQLAARERSEMPSTSRMGDKSGVTIYGAGRLSRVGRWSRRSSVREARTRCGSPRGGTWWSGRFAGERWARAAQLGDGTLAIEASCERGLTDARFVLCADDERAGFHRAFARDPLLGPAVRTLRGMRPKRRSTVTQAAVRAICGQLIQATTCARDRAGDHPGLWREPADAGGARAALTGEADSVRARGEPLGDPRAARANARPRRAQSAPPMPSRGCAASAASARGR